jgi:hypothetical protein
MGLELATFRLLARTSINYATACPPSFFIVGRLFKGPMYRNIASNDMRIIRGSKHGFEESSRGLPEGATWSWRKTILLLLHGLSPRANYTD